MRSSFFAASLGLAVSSLAQAPQELKPAAAFDRFQAEHGGQWVVQWHRATGTPSSLYGTGLVLDDWRENTLEEARRHAELQLRMHHDLLGLGTSEFRESIGARMGRTWSFTFDQYYRGLPVVDGRADVRINMKGVVAMLGSAAVPIPANFHVVPALTEAVAVAAAWTAVGAEPNQVPQPGTARQPRLVIWADLAREDAIATPHLAFEVPISNVDANGKGPIGRYYIDAVTGAVLHYRNDKHECGSADCKFVAETRREPAAPPVPTTVTLMCWTRTGIDALSPLVNVPLPGIVLNVPGATPSLVTTDANGSFTIDITGPVTITVGNLDGRHHNPMLGSAAPTGSFTVNPGAATTLQLSSAAAVVTEAAHPTTAWYIDSVNEWARSILGNSAQLNTADAVVPTVNINSTCNAYYTNNSVNFYQAGSGCSNTAFSNVITHEWGHGLDDRYGGISNNTGDGLSEGWSDLIGMYHVDSPLLGSGFQSAGTPLRHGMNNTMYGTQTAVHDAGEVWMGFAWRYRENLRAAFGTPAAIAISNTTVVGTIVANAVNQAGAVQQVFLADDDDGNLLNGTPHYAQLSAAAIAKGLPYPQVFLAVNHTPLASPAARFTSRLVSATVAPVGAGSVTAVRLHYNTGGGPVVRNMKPTLFPDEYAAILPGKNAGSMSYHIEADHSGGSTLRLPGTGEYTYAVNGGNYVGFYNEDFETGGTGWTFGATTGAGEWQLGTPAGKNGTSLSVFWADPANAVSGSSCFAVDLGIGSSNGRYNGSTDQYLRSTVIDCTGKYGVRLRFQRWLTVERGVNDQATVSCNGVQVWANPLTTNLLDSSWQLVEYDLPMADNNPAVQIEWRLTTDASLQLGGWQIDDVQLGSTQVATPDAVLSMAPEQVASGQTTTISVVTPGGPRPFLVGLGDLPGPTSIPGIPTIQVGGVIDVFSATTDAIGNWNVTFPAIAVPSAVGVVFYMQVLTFDPTYTSLVVSNGFVIMFTQTP